MFEESLPLLTLASVHPLHTSHNYSPQVPLMHPTFAGVTLFPLQKMGLQSFNPSSPSTHPPLLPSVGSTAGGKRGGGGSEGMRGGGMGRIPRSIPTNFLISFASMLCPKFTPLTYPPYSLSFCPLLSHLCALLFWQKE